MTKNTTIISVAPREWRFQLSGSDKVWSLPLMGSLPLAVARKVAKMVGLDDESAMIDAAFDLFDELCPGLVDAVTTDQLAAIMVGWKEASSIEPGESQASSD